MHRLVEIVLLYLLAPCLAHQSQSFLQEQDVDHIRQDIKEQYHVELHDNQEENEMAFYNFQLHDYDKNMKLDGLELIVGISHHVQPEEDKFRKMNSYEKRNFWHDVYDRDSKLVDQIIEQYDKNNDGYISFEEYMQTTVKLSQKG